MPRLPGQISDGYHTFDELYMHRNMLFIALMKAAPENFPWRARRHHDGTFYDGWFIVGIETPDGHVTYHLPDKLWHLLDTDSIETLEYGKEWDGHTSQDVVDRLWSLIKDLA